MPLRRTTGAAIWLAAVLLAAPGAQAQVAVEARLTPPASGWDAPAVGDYVTVRLHIGTPDDATALRFAGANVFYDPDAYTLVSRALGPFATSRDYDDSDGQSDGFRIFRHDANLNGDARNAFSFSVALFDGAPLIPADGSVAFTAVLQVRQALPAARYAMRVEEVELRNGAGTLVASAPRVTYESRPTSGTAAGWRLVSVPTAAATVATLAGLNLVQGVGTSGQPGAEFAGSTPNLFTGYTGQEAGPYAGFTVPAATTEALAPGKGALWYFFAAGGPEPGDSRGVSRRAALPLTFRAAGLPTTGAVTASFTSGERAGSTNGFYLLGNPYAWPFDLSALSASAGTLSDVVQLYRAGTGWQTITRQPGDASAADDVAPWQGLFAEVTTTGGAAYVPPPGTPLVFSYSPAGAAQTTPGFVGKGGTSGSGTSEPDTAALLRLSLRGTLGGQALVDEAASLAFADDAVLGWDRLDASKLGALTSPAVELAVGGTRAGAALWQAQRSLPRRLGAAQAVPLRLGVPAPMRLTLAWEDVPADVALELVDAGTGSTQALVSGGSYGFEAVPGDSLRLSLRVGTSAATAIAPEARLSELIVFGLSPNPAGAGGARLRVQVGQAQPVRVTVLDALGREVLVVFHGPAGPELRLDIPTDALPSGVYLVRVTGLRTATSRPLVVTH